MWLWISVVFFSSLNLHNAAAHSQMCEEPFKATITLVTNVTIPISASSFDPDLLHFRKTLRFTEEEIDREREAAMRFYIDMYGLDFTNINLMIRNREFWEMQHLNPVGVQSTLQQLVGKRTNKNQVLSSTGWWLSGTLYRSNDASWKIWGRRRKISSNKRKSFIWI